LALERERSFTRYASHELRTPLTTLSAYVSGAQQGLVPADEALDVAERNLARIQRTLSGLLELARGPSELSLVVVPDLIQDVLKDYSEAEQARIRLSLENAVIEAPRVALQGAIRNLLENALRYSEGPVCLRLHQGSSLCITVRDYGKGVPEAALNRLSEPFYRLNSDVAGSGLGLAYVRQVAEGLGGGLTLRNHPEGGLEATLVLPGGHRV
jgi:signal transduction histidine kinase